MYFLELLGSFFINILLFIDKKKWLLNLFGVVWILSLMVIETFAWLILREKAQESMISSTSVALLHGLEAEE